MTEEQKTAGGTPAARQLGAWNRVSVKCPGGFRCERILEENGCKEHSEDQKLAQEQILKVKSFKHKGLAFAYYNEERHLKLYRFQNIPVHFSKQPKLDNPENYYYKIKLLKSNREGTSMKIELVDLLECNPDNEMKIVDHYYLGENLQPELHEIPEENKTSVIGVESFAPNFKANTITGDSIDFHEWLGDSWGVVFSFSKAFIASGNPDLGYGKFKLRLEQKGVKVIGFSLDDPVQDLPDNFPCIVYPLSEDYNRYFFSKIENGAQINDKTVFVIDSYKRVKYIFSNPDPEAIDFDESIRAIDELKRPGKEYYGHLIPTLKGYILPCSANTAAEMIVLQMDLEFYRKIGQKSPFFSCVKDSKIDSKYIDNYFFAAELLQNPTRGSMKQYCRITNILGPFVNEQAYKQVIYCKYGIYHQMYPQNAIKEGLLIKRQFNSTIQNTEEPSAPLIFTIDETTTRSYDDALSIIKITDSIYKIEIHISDVARFIKKGSIIDKEAFKRRKTQYVINDEQIPMLPKDINIGISSLKQGEQRAVVTLSINMNQDGIVDFKSLEYQQKIIKVSSNLSYKEAEQLIINDNKDDQISQNLKELALLSQARKNFRNQCLGGNQFTQAKNQDEETKTSKMIIEEMMLLTQSCLKYYMENTLNLAYNTYQKLQDYQQQRADLLALTYRKIQSEDLQIKTKQSYEAVDSIKKSKSVTSQSELYSPSISTFIEIEEDDEYKLNIWKEDLDDDEYQTTDRVERQKQNLRVFFNEIEIQIKFDSRETIIDAFNRAKINNQSKAFSKLVDFQYTVSYQYFSRMIEHQYQQVEETKTEEQKEISQIQDQKQDHSEESNGETDSTQDDLIDQELDMEEEEKKDEENLEKIFDQDLNRQLICDLIQIPKDKYLKYQNPIRDYFDLLSNRLIHLLIELNQYAKETDKNFRNLRQKTAQYQLQRINSQVKMNLIKEFERSLEIKIYQITNHLKFQFRYQHDIRYIHQYYRQGLFKSELERVIYAFDILEHNGKNRNETTPYDWKAAQEQEQFEDVHICSRQRIGAPTQKIFHPVLGYAELELKKNDSGEIMNRPLRNSTQRVKTKITSLVPLQFSHTQV